MDVDDTNKVRCLSFKLPELEEYYGNFVKDCYHGEGTYQWHDFLKFTFEGYFYANSKDGYGTMSYPDGAIFQGLFKENIPFGPGVLTSSNGCQDVGQWLGERLIRLAIIVGRIPQLATSDEARLKLLEFHRVVDVYEKNEIPKLIFEQLGANNEILNQYKMLYSDYVKHPKSIFFNTPYFDQHFFGDSSVPMEIMMEEDNLEDMSNQVNEDMVQMYDIEIEQTEKEVTRAEIVDEPLLVLAWNNGDIAVDLLKHSFRHRKFEENLWFSNAHIIGRKRKHFREPGRIEHACKKFLEMCFNNELNNLEKILRHHNLDPDVSDALGNSAIIYATNGDNCELIEKLIELEANVNVCNDEGLTPLSLSFLRYLATYYNVSDWSLAFLPIDDSTSKMSKNGIAEKYIFDLSFSSLVSHCPSPEKADTKKSKAIKKESKKKQKEKKKIIQKKQVSESKVNICENEATDIICEEKLSQLNTIETTIITLLEKGADPALIQVPIPGVFLALFCGKADLVEKTLDKEGCPNIKLSEEAGGLSLLHAASLLSPTKDLLEVVNMLLIRGADPNSTSTVEYALPYISQLTVTETSEDLHCGLNPLQILCLRPDAEHIKEKKLLAELCSLLAKVTDTSTLFLGYSVLSMAIVSGNVSIVQSLLTSNNISPNQLLNLQLGTALTVLLDPIRLKFVTAEKIIQMMDFLIDAGADPLISVIVGDFNDSSVEYALTNLNKLQAPVLVKSGPKSGKKGKYAESDEVKSYKMVVENLIKKMQELITKYIQRKVVRTLMKVVRSKKSHEDDLRDHPSVFKAQYWFDCKNLLKNLQEMVENGALSASKQDIKEAIYLTTKEQELTNEEKQTISFITEKSKWNVKKKEGEHREGTSQLRTDDIANKYRICFQCGKRNCELFACPICGLIFYCSQTCQNTSLSEQSMTEHKCFRAYLVEEKDELSDMDSSDGKGRKLKSKTFSTAKVQEMKHKTKRKGLGSKSEEENTQYEESDSDYSTLEPRKIKSKSESIQKRKESKLKKGKERKYEENFESRSKHKDKKNETVRVMSTNEFKDNKQNVGRARKHSRSEKEQRETSEFEDSLSRKHVRTKKDKMTSKQKQLMKTKKERTEDTKRSREIETKTKEDKSRSRGKSTDRKIIASKERNRDDKDRKHKQSRSRTRETRNKYKEEHGKDKRGKEGKYFKETDTTVIHKKTLHDVIKEKFTSEKNKFDKKGKQRFEKKFSFVLQSLSFHLGLKSIVPLPYIVLKEGNLYYKFYGIKPAFIENYSLV